MHETHFESSLEHMFMDPTSRDSDSVGLDWVLTVCTSHKLTDAAIPQMYILGFAGQSVSQLFNSAIAVQKQL